jgi:hypothetical protein
MSDPYTTPEALERLNPFVDFGLPDMRRHPRGRYVRYEDYAALSVERAALKAENARLRDELADALTAIEECKEEIDQSIRNEYPHDHPVQERYRKRDFEANPARVFLYRRAALRDMGVE